MRLTDDEVEAICRLFKVHFGPEAHLWLFGSRVNNTKHGGDIDLYVESPQSDLKLLLHAKIAYLIDLEREIGDRHVDILLKGASDLPIHHIARTTGVQLV